MSAPAPLAHPSISEERSLSGWLRDVTREEHDAVEAAFDLALATSSRERYLETLKAFARVFCPLAQGLDAVQIWDRLRLQNLRTDALVRDIAFFGETIAPAPPPVWLNSLSSAAGCAYVLEGSRLGGQLIAKQATVALQLNDGGTEFFLGEGKDTARMWREFRGAIDAMLDLDEREVLRGAQETFRMFQKELGGRN